MKNELKKAEKNQTKREPYFLKLRLLKGEYKSQIAQAEPSRATTTSDNRAEPSQANKGED